MSNVLTFSEDLRDAAQEKLIDRITEAVQDDYDCARSMVEFGFPAIQDLDGEELLSEYMNWYGLFDLDDEDEQLKRHPLVYKMLEEKASFKFEKVILTDEEVNDE